MYSLAISFRQKVNVSLWSVTFYLFQFVDIDMLNAFERLEMCIRDST